MKQRFSKDFLYFMRNYVPITEVVENLLKLPCKYADGQFRFLCPECYEIRAVVNPQTNLGRCFFCKKNFNPIDLVIIAKHIKFVQAVEFLTPLAHHHHKILQK